MSKDTNRFDEAMKHNDPIVVDTASLLHGFTQSYENGEMSEAEYKELALDLLDMQRIEDAISDLKRRSDIAKAFQQLLKIVNIIGKIV